MHRHWPSADEWRAVTLSHSAVTAGVLEKHPTFQVPLGVNAERDALRLLDDIFGAETQKHKVWVEQNAHLVTSDSETLRALVAGVSEKPSTAL